ncbi:hypothetical protein [Sphingopyxis flava]|uniref:Uncharacterized protein n=1 Tax=Sphingopyxis flava TaxID=1507287 RepID=A0A1T5ENG5_9SPHN|nr:hypothetical protein [Sphingopyxis flava]SKB85369.1 hypothetical protein SAMN06295937_102351 [Sphingopyxis flava]
MSVTDIAEARRRREDRRAAIVAAADWLIHNTVFWQSWRDNAEFYRRWPDFEAAELEAVGRDAERRVAIQLPTPITAADLDAAVAGLTGRYELWTRASNWLLRYWPARGLDDPEFVRHFGEMTMAELVLAAIERERRQLRALGQIP